MKKKRKEKFNTEDFFHSQHFQKIVHFWLAINLLSLSKSTSNHQQIMSECAADFEYRMNEP